MIERQLTFLSLKLRLGIYAELLEITLFPELFAVGLVSPAHFRDH
jgi:hypothetical protein